MKFKVYDTLLIKRIPKINKSDLREFFPNLRHPQQTNRKLKTRNELQFHNVYDIRMFREK